MNKTQSYRLSPPILRALLSLLFVSTAAAAEKPLMRIVEKEGGYLVREGAAKVLFYQRAAKSLDGNYERAGYVHPLYDLDGQVLTEDFPKDHPHHRGIFWAWHQTWVGDKAAGDGWAIKDYSWDVTNVEIVWQSDTAATLRATVLWQSPLIAGDDGKPTPLVKETTTITAHRAGENLRLIDFEIALEGLLDEVRIGGSEDDKGYGGFSTRVRLPEDIRFNSRQGELTPQRTSVEGGPWLDCLASFNKPGETSGLAVLCHPTLPGFPQPWILRSARSMQNPAWPGREAVALPRGKPLVLRYRLVVHRGDSEQAGIDKLQQQYARETFADSK